MPIGYSQASTTLGSTAAETLVDVVVVCVAQLLEANVFFFQAEDGIRDADVTGVQTCALPICAHTTAGPGGPAPRPASASPRPRPPTAGAPTRRRPPAAPARSWSTWPPQDPRTRRRRSAVPARRRTPASHRGLA